MSKGQTRHEYPPGAAEVIRSTCLHLATHLHGLAAQITVVGGLVPSLLVDQRRMKGPDLHAGTRDLDLGLSLALLEHQRYKELADRLRAAGFEPDRTQQGRVVRQRWRSRDRPEVTVDFLIPPASDVDADDQRIQNLEADFAAIVTPGLNLVLRDRRQVTLSGRTLLDEKATRKVWVCGPGAFVVLKALAFRGRGEPKDAYDLFYVLANFGSGPPRVATRVRLLLDDPATHRAIEILNEDFLDPEALGPRRVASFLHGGVHEGTQADVVGLVRDLLSRCTRSTR